VAGYVVSFERADLREVGYWIGKEFWGRGIATLALGSFLECDPARPLHARVAKSNRGSVRVLEKCGFTICADETVPPLVERGKDGVEESLLRLD